MVTLRQQPGGQVGSGSSDGVSREGHARWRWRWRSVRVKGRSGGGGWSCSAPPPTRSSCSATGSSGATWRRDRKSTRLNSSHVKISYAVFCLKKKKKKKN